MTIGRAVTLLAGTMVLVSLLLSQLHSPYWLWLTARDAGGSLDVQADEGRVALTIHMPN